MHVQILNMAIYVVFYNRYVFKTTNFINKGQNRAAVSQKA